MEPITCDSIADVKRSLSASFSGSVQRSSSQPVLRMALLTPPTCASDLAQPGGFRRAFVGHTGEHATFRMPVISEMSRSSMVYGGMTRTGTELSNLDNRYEAIAAGHRAWESS